MSAGSGVCHWSSSRVPPVARRREIPGLRKDLISRLLPDSNIARFPWPFHFLKSLAVFISSRAFSYLPTKSSTFLDQHVSTRTLAAIDLLCAHFVFVWILRASGGRRSCVFAAADLEHTPLCVFNAADLNGDGLLKHA